MRIFQMVFAHAGLLTCMGCSDLISLALASHVGRVVQFDIGGKALIHPGTGKTGIPHGAPRLADLPHNGGVKTLIGLLHESG